MKLFGTSRKSRHLASRKGRQAETAQDAFAAYSEKNAFDEEDRFSTARLLGMDDTSDSAGEGEKLSEKERQIRRLSTPLRIVIVISTVLAAVVAGLMIAWSIFVKPPEVSTYKRTPPSGTGTAVSDSPFSGDGSGKDADEPNGAYSDDGNGYADPEDTDGDGRNAGKYTFLFLGTDAGSGNTDTIMIATFDTVNYKLDLVSIPRDTMVNVSWSVKKVNTLHASCGSDGMIGKFADILGYDVDFYALVNLKSFVKLVDAIGGIDYNVPVNMNYEDPVQDLYIHIRKGQQHLSGEEAMKVMRFRKGYSDQDIGRIGTQQDLIRTAAQQILENADDIPLTTLIDIIVNDVDTDLSAGNLMWFAKEFFKMDMENINFHILPGNYEDHVYQGSQYVSYVTIYPDEWVEMINEYLNPFSEPVLLEDLNILTRNPATKKIYPTSGVYAGKPSWGN